MSASFLAASSTRASDASKAVPLPSDAHGGAAKTVASRIFILAGQSNMVGRGEPDKFPAQDASIRLMYNNDGHRPNEAAAESEGWIPLQVQEFLCEHEGRTDKKHFGPEATLGGAIGGESVYLAKFACGSTCLRDHWHPTHAAPHYQRLLAFCKRAVAEAPQPASLQGFFWLQGESDVDTKNERTYSDDFAEFIKRLRADLAAPRLPVVASHVLWKPKKDRKVNEALSLACANQLTRATVTLALDLKQNPAEKNHLDTESVLEVGRRMGAAWRALTSRHSALPPTLGSGFSLLTYNLLSHHYVRCPNLPHTNFDHCSADVLDWMARAPRVVQTILAANADVVCLQEMGLEACTGGVGGEACMPEWTRPLLEAGYTCVLQNDPKRAAGQLTANALLYRSSRLRLESAVHKSRAMLCFLRSTAAEGPLFAVACVHLEGHPDKHQERSSQLSSAIKEVEKSSEPVHLIVAGDFNSALDDDALPLAKLLGRGTRFGLHDALPPSGGAELGSWTESGGPGLASAIDHILLSQSLRVVLRRPTLDGAAEVEAVRANGLPSHEHPSDHLPLALALEVAAPPVACAPPPAAASAAASAPPDDAQPELLARWRAILAEAPPAPPGQPSEEERLKLRVHAQNKKAFLKQADVAPFAKWLEKQR